VAFKSGWAPSPTATETYLNRAILGEEGSPATVAVINMTEAAPIALQTPMAFTIAGALLSPDPADVVVYRNGSRLPDGSVFPGATWVDLGSQPGDFVPRTPLHARSRGPLRPAPLAWLTRSARSRC
jgi:hypothetical protein